jgi:hypothetical protein
MRERVVLALRGGKGKRITYQQTHYAGLFLLDRPDFASDGKGADLGRVGGRRDFLARVGLFFN